MNTHSHHPSQNPVGRHPDRPARTRVRPSEEPSDTQAGGFSSILRRYPLVLGITALTAGGMAAADAAVRAIRSLAMAELLCVAAGIAVVLCLPEIHNKGETA